MQIHVETKKTGPIFRPGLRGRIGRAKEAAMQQLVEMGEERMAQMLRPRPAGVYLTASQAGPGRASTGHYRRNIHTAVQNGVGVIHDSGVVYGPWLEGVSKRNASTRFKGYAVFRKTRDRLGDQMSRVVGAHVMRVLRRR